MLVQKADYKLQWKDNVMKGRGFVNLHRCLRTALNWGTVNAPMLHLSLSLAWKRHLLSKFILSINFQRTPLWEKTFFFCLNKRINIFKCLFIQIEPPAVYLFCQAPGTVVECWWKVNCVCTDSLKWMPHQRVYLYVISMALSVASNMHAYWY